MDTDPGVIAPEPRPGPPEVAGMDRLLQGSTLYLIGNLAFKAVGFVMIPFYARYLSTDEYGVLNLLELATSIVAITFGLSSLGQALVRIYHDHADEADRRAVVSTALIGTFVLAGLVVLFGVAFAAPIARAINIGSQAGLLRIAFAAMFFSSVGEMVLVYERIHDRARFYLIYSLIVLCATLSLNIALIGWWRQGVYGFVFSKLVVTTLGCAFLLTRTLREVGIAWRPTIARALLRFVGPLVVSGLCYFAIHFADRLFLAQVSRADVGVYALVYTFAFQLSALIGDSFSKSWGVSFYSYASGDGWQDRFVQVGRWLVFVLGAGSIAIALFGRDFLVLMVPASYDPPKLLLPVLVFGYFLREVGDFFNSILLIGSGSGLVGRIAVFGAVLNMALNALLIPVFGIWGAAWATFGTWAAYCLVCWIAAWRLRGVAMPPGPLAVILLLSALCLAAQFLWVGAAPVPRLALDCVAFAAFIVLAAVVYLRPAERQDAFTFGQRGFDYVSRQFRLFGKA
jgi:O-antigen/teichoic acid export membrane protein